MKATKEALLNFTDTLITQGQRTLGTRYEGSDLILWVEPEPFGQFLAGYMQLMYMLGSPSSPWSGLACNDTPHAFAYCSRLLGATRAVREAIASDLLVRLEDLAIAEAFADLLEQADYLLNQGFHVAAGVLGRAVLEEHLRKLCDREGITLSKDRPTINGYNTELYKKPVYDKIVMKHVDAMATIGNDAAHGKPVDGADIERLLRDVRGFLIRY